MKPYVLAGSRPAPSRRSVAVVASLAACFLLSIALALRGCMNEHDRPGGHGDISFVVSPRGDTIVGNERVKLTHLGAK